jgi:2-dehydropantoate 2-reductase
MRIAVMGAGGVGGYFGARLAQAGHQVSFIARGRHLEALRTQGLRLKSALGDAALKVRAFQDPREAGQADVVLFAVKLWDTESAAEQLRPIVGSGVVIPFQNGVESVDRIGAVLGKDKVMGGSAYIATRIAAPGLIEHTGTMARLRFGPLMPSQRSAAEDFLAICKKSGVNAELSEEIALVNWEKFAFLVAMSGTTALARAPLGVVRGDPDLRWMFEQAMHEAWTLARRRGIKLADDFVEKQMAFAETLPAEMRASMLHDLAAGNRLEAPWLCGAVVRMAQEHGLAAPVNRAIYAALKPYVDGSQSKAA